MIGGSVLGSEKCFMISGKCPDLLWGQGSLLFNERGVSSPEAKLSGKQVDH
jgi:hypothetical protein